ncbi:hypothetical protein TIFTF001_040336 [Ficus carica]|uniref:Uncharacterized protein n=1 Tax=Ficus carica TaxID=3494 RepID=A0AA87YZV3_FICCA|nr:hypothetical protein TIFTF001_040336 [Ficus carica]
MLVRTPTFQGLDSYLYPSSSRRKPTAVPGRGAALLVLAERKLTSYVYAVVLNLGRSKEDHEAPLTFRGMEEKLRIFNKTQAVVARYGDPPQIMSYRRSCTYLSRYVLRSAASSLGTAAGFLLLVERHSHLGEVVWPYWLAIPLENKGRLLSLKSNDDLMRCHPPLGVVGHEGLGMQVLAQQAVACFT